MPVDLLSFGEPGGSDLVTYYRRLGREVWALDLTTDLGIPVFVAASRSIHGPEETLLFGAGCHLDTRTAWQRAFTEMHQLVSLTLTPEGRVRPDLRDDDLGAWVQKATLDRYPYLAPAPPQQHRQGSDHRSHPTGNVPENIDTCRRRIEAEGLEVLLLDQTRPDLGVPTVKMVVPGLRHVGARFAPGRLYDVPVQMGWLETCLAEQELNPVRFPF